MNKAWKKHLLYFFIQNVCSLMLPSWFAWIPIKSDAPFIHYWFIYCRCPFYPVHCSSWRFFNNSPNVINSCPEKWIKHVVFCSNKDWGRFSLKGCSTCCWCVSFPVLEVFVWYKHCCHRWKLLSILPEVFVFFAYTDFLAVCSLQW